LAKCDTLDLAKKCQKSRELCQKQFFYRQKHPMFRQKLCFWRILEIFGGIFGESFMERMVGE